MPTLRFARRAASTGAMALALSAGIALAQEEQSLLAPEAITADDQVADLLTATPVMKCPPGHLFICASTRTSTARRTRQATGTQSRCWSRSCWMTARSFPR